MILAPSTSSAGSGTEVAIPVVGDDEKETSALDESSLPTPLGTVTNYSTRRLPTISVTKPPAPMPVDLPSPSNLTPDDDEIRPAFPPQNDIEGNPVRQEFMSTVPLTAVPPRKARSRSPSPKLTLEIQTNLVDSPEEALKAVEIVTSPVAVPDLLHEDATLVGSSEADAVLGSYSKAEDDSPVLIDAEDAPSNQEPETTIRLVGGGGVSGAAEDSLVADGVLVDEHEGEHADADAADAAAEVASIKSVDSKASKKTHGRKKSSVSASLKKLGHLGGGKRKTDSAASVDLKQ